MIHLAASDIEKIPGTLVPYDHFLESVTGVCLKGIGLKAAALGEDPRTDQRMAATRIAVVPVTGQQGVVAGLSEAIASILRHLGFDLVTTVAPDVAGIADAMDVSADILFMADGRRFIALCVRERTYIDNTEAAAEGFVTGLSLMAGGLMGKGVLVIGCGRVGSAAAATLIRQNAEVTLIDRNSGKSRELKQRLEPVSSAPLFVADDLKAALRSHEYIVEASNSADIIHEADITADALIAAPGMPFGVGPKARKRLAGRVLHDPLQIGVAAMAFMALKKLRR